MPRTAVAGAVETVEALVPEDDGSAEAAMREKVGLRYNTVRPFLPLLGESEALAAAPAGQRVLKAVRRLPALSRRRVKDRPLLPRRSTPIWCPPCGSGRCSPTPSCPRAQWTGTPGDTAVRDETSAPTTPRVQPPYVVGGSIPVTRRIGRPRGTGCG